MKLFKMVLLAILITFGLFTILGSGGGGGGGSDSVDSDPNCLIPEISEAYIDQQGNIEIFVHNPGRNIEYMEWQIENDFGSFSGIFEGSTAANVRYTLKNGGPVAKETWLRVRFGYCNTVTNWQTFRHVANTKTLGFQNDELIPVDNDTWPIETE